MMRPASRDDALTNKIPARHKKPHTSQGVRFFIHIYTYIVEPHQPVLFFLPAQSHRALHFLDHLIGFAARARPAFIEAIINPSAFDILLDSPLELSQKARTDFTERSLEFAVA